jgi:hypothetical protein
MPIPKIVTYTTKLFGVPPMEARSGLIMVSFRIQKWGVKLDSWANLVD